MVSMCLLAYTLLSYVKRCWPLYNQPNEFKSPEEDRIETTGNKLDSLTSDSASASLHDATSQQTEVETETKNSAYVYESLGEGEVVRNPSITALIFLNS